MAFASSRLFFLPHYPSSPFTFKHSTAPFPKPPLCPPIKNPHSLLAAASPQPSPFASEQALFDAVADFEATEKSLPAIRTYENDLARLSLVGAVDFRQAVTAAAAEGGGTADEHLSSGLETMVVETLFPGHADDHSTVGTRLFLPSRKVKERALRLKKLMTEEVLHGTTSSNILAMTFRQVVMQHLGGLELALFRPGTERNMNNLGNSREVPSLTLSSSDERIVSAIGEVVSFAALEDIERQYFHDTKASSGVFSWFNKHEQISSRDHSVVLHNLLEHEILANAKILLEKFNLERGKYKLKRAKLKNGWWTCNAFSKLEKIGGPEFCVWLSEFVPSYMLEIDSNKFGDVKFEGWKKLDKNRWEVVLTHSQMVSFADVLDMYFEDIFTLPDKRLSCHSVAKPTTLNHNKGNSFLKALSIVLVSGVFLVTISVLGKLCLPHLPMRTNFIKENSRASSSEINCVPLPSVEFSELEMVCVSIIRRIKESFGWPGEIRKESSVCAWIGELPKFLRNVDDTDSNMLDITSTSISLAASEEEKKALEDIASYQVVVTSEGSIVGFQPTNRVAVNSWAANPLAKVLYGGKKLSPGLLEPGLKISRPRDVVVLELLMLSNPNSYFAMVRALDVSEEVR